MKNNKLDNFPTKPIDFRIYDNKSLKTIFLTTACKLQL